MKNVLIVAAHPDDEVLGVGGTAAKLVEKGCRVYCLILGEGATSRKEKREDTGKEVVDELQEDTQKAGNIIGYTKIFFSELPDNRFDSIDLLDVVKEVEKVIEEIKPEIIFTHHPGDLNVDHQISFKAVMTATRPQNNHPTKKVYTFETLSSTEWQSPIDKEKLFSPNTFIDISFTLNKKIEALNAYRTELREFPHPRSLEGVKVLAKKRGMDVGFTYAEAFCLVRSIGDY